MNKSIVTDEMLKGVHIESTLNRKGDVLPFGYYDPKTEGKLVWICNYGIEGNEIVSVYTMKTEDGQEKDVKYLKDIEQAIYIRDELIKNGWLQYKLPEIEIKTK